MHIYLDESGETGFKFRQGSSRFFVIALVLVDDSIPIHQAIHDFRLELGWPETQEFKFVSTYPAAREGFFRAIRPYPFKVRSLVVHKERLIAPHMRKKETFYNFLVKQVLHYDFGTISNATLIIDESFKGKDKKAALTTYLRQQLNTPGEAAKKITDVRYHESHRDNLLQVADMTVGAIARAYEKGDDQYRRLLKGKLQDVWVFPPSGK